jgi:hypothetical protein
MRRFSPAAVALAAVVATTAVTCSRGRAEHDPPRAVGAAAPSLDLAPTERDRRWDAAVAALAARRRALATELRAARGQRARARVLARARDVAFRAIVDDLAPLWLGMPWGLGRDSTATRPHQPGMVVGCSYFVTSVLLGAGVHLDDRFRFAQAPALRIQRALAAGDRAVHRYLSIPADRLERAIAGLGDGLYLVGLDVHVGFVVVDGGAVRLLHASYTGGRQVTDEPLEGAIAIANSREEGYFVSPVFVRSPDNDALVERWLAGAPLSLAD